MTHRRSIRLPLLAAVAVTGSLLVAVPASPAAAAPAATTAITYGAGSVISAGGTRVETPVRSTSPVTSVVESAVSVYAPLPASVGPVPPACQWLSYLRYRDKAGPAASAQAAKVLVAQPGSQGGAGSLDSIARNTVADASAQGSHVEFWALDRRSNCLEDNRGVLAALAARDVTVAIDYYYHHKVVDGHTFGGYLAGSQVRWLADIGMDQTVRDQYAVMSHELPAAYRKDRTFCGGHSLGGVITAFFAGYDFGGHPGYDQCAGYFALETTISTAIGSGSPTGAPDALTDQITKLGAGGAVGALKLGLLPADLDLPAVLNPETTTLLSIAGLAAEIDPDGLSKLTALLPEDANLAATYRILFSKDLIAFATGSPSIKDFTITNDAVLGGLLDDNSQPVGALNASVGFFTGGKIVDKNFPAPSTVLAMPDDTKATYRWLNYDQVAGAAIAKNSTGEPYTTAAKEVTDIRELARSLAESPLNFTENYFPTRLVIDSTLGASAPASVAPGYTYYDGVTRHPVVNIIGSDGLVLATGAKPAPGAVVLPGYNHLDVVTAATTQNDGKPEQGAAALAAFVLTH